MKAKKIRDVLFNRPRSFTINSGVADVKIWRPETQIHPPLTTGKSRGAVRSCGANFQGICGPSRRWRAVRGAAGFAARTRCGTDQPGRRATAGSGRAVPPLSPAGAVNARSPGALRAPTLRSEWADVALSGCPPDRPGGAGRKVPPGARIIF